MNSRKTFQWLKLQIRVTAEYIEAPHISVTPSYVCFTSALFIPPNKHESQHITQNLRVVKKIWIFPGHVSKYTTVFNLDEDVVSLSVVTICSRDFSNDASNVLHHLT